jgi:hypothetical protein
MLHKEFWGLLLLAFVAWVFIAATPQQRIENVCRPVGWGGNATTSLTALTLPAHQQSVQRWFDKFEYGCRFTVWRLFFQDAYNKWLEAQAQQQAAPAQAGAPPKPGPAEEGRAPTGPAQEPTPAQPAGAAPSSASQ